MECSSIKHRPDLPWARQIEDDACNNTKKDTRTRLINIYIVYYLPRRRSLLRATDVFALHSEAGQCLPSLRIRCVGPGSPCSFLAIGKVCFVYLKDITNPSGSWHTWARRPVYKSIDCSWAKTPLPKSISDYTPRTYRYIAMRKRKIQIHSRQSPLSCPKMFINYFPLMGLLKDYYYEKQINSERLETREVFLGVTETSQEFSPLSRNFFRLGILFD